MITEQLTNLPGLKFNNPSILVSDLSLVGGMPVLIDFGSASGLAANGRSSRRPSGWIDARVKDFTTSKKEL